MKKLAFAGAVIALFLLIFGARKLQTRRLERESARFRGLFLQHAPVVGTGHLAEVDLNSGQMLLGNWEGAELDEALQSVHMIPARQDDENAMESHISFHITTGDAMSAAEGIYLSTDADEGWIYFVPMPMLQSRVG